MLRILVCDDQAMLRELLAGAIWAHSPEAEVVLAAEGKDAELKLASGRFDLVFMDVEMPLQDGFTTLANVREQKLAPEAAFIMCTGRFGDEDRARGLALKVDHYLTKPIDLMTVGQVVKRFAPMASTA